MKKIILIFCFFCLGFKFCLNAQTGVTTFRWTQKLRLSALTLEDEKSKQPLQLGI